MIVTKREKMKRRRYRLLFLFKKLEEDILFLIDNFDYKRTT